VRASCLHEEWVKYVSRIYYRIDAIAKAVTVVIDEKRLGNSVFFLNIYNGGLSIEISP
jgi:hypothetical protein